MKRDASAAASLRYTLDRRGRFESRHHARGLESTNDGVHDEIANDADAELDSQLTVAVAVPGFVLDPVCQLHFTVPDPSAEAGPRPRDSLCAPLGRVTERLHAALGAVCAVSDAYEPAETLDVSDTTRTPEGASAVGGAVEVVTAGGVVGEVVEVGAEEIAQAGWISAHPL